MHVQGNVISGKCTFREMYIRVNIVSAKCFSGKCNFWKMFFGEVYRIPKEVLLAMAKKHLLFDFVNLYTRFKSFLTKKENNLENRKKLIFREFVCGPISSPPLSCLLFRQDQNSLIYFKYCINLVFFSCKLKELMANVISARLSLQDKLLGT